MTDFTRLADDIAAMGERLTDEIFNAVRAQLRNEGPEAAKEVERTLSRARRSLVKAEQILRAHDAKDEEDARS